MSGYIKRDVGVVNIKLQPGDGGLSFAQSLEADASRWLLLPASHFCARLRYSNMLLAPASHLACIHKSDIKRSRTMQVKLTSQSVQVFL